MRNIEAFVLSNIGNVRDNHEDNFFIPKNCYIDSKKQKEIKSNSMCIEYEYTGNEGIFAICDGMGGHNAGEVASRIAVENTKEEYNNILVDDKKVLIDFVKKLNNNICDYSEHNVECNDMGTTFSSIVIVNDNIYLLHVGDSRIYKYEDNELIQLSKDHTEGCRMIEAGIIKEQDILKFPNRKVLYKYLGRPGDLIADCELLSCKSQSRLIISSDGLSDTLEKDEIQNVVAESKMPKEVCNNLINMCLKKGNKCSDNVTIICIDIN